MRRWIFVAFVCLVVSGFSRAANLIIAPTTTLSAQTSNNTSASSAFLTQSNGNLGASNVSKINIHSLLYPGADTKVYAHLVLWFGQSNHMAIGYSSTDVLQVRRQIHDMISRGIDGVILDWYGPNNAIDQAAQLVMHEAENHPGFTFAIMVDQGAIQWDSCAGCSPQQALIQQMQYIEQRYFPSPAYMRLNGAPVVGNFDIDLHYTVDWNGVKAALATAPAFIFQNNPGFSHVLSGGSDSWVMPATADYGMSYLKSFYQLGMTYAKEETIGGSYKGFNDSLAAWGSKRVMSQQCGGTWLQTFSMIRSLYNSSRPLPSLQLVTWNDYEEGTEIESGIDNCVSISASTAGSALQWKISGSESTLDHYTTYISLDGQNLMKLADISTGQRSVNLCSYALDNRNFKLYVQAVGKPGLTNHISGGVSYTPHCGSSSSSGSAAAASLNASPSAMTLSPDGPAATTTVELQSENAPDTASVALSCGELPAGLSCEFVPKQISPGAQAVLTVSTPRRQSSNKRALPNYAAWLGFSVVGFVGLGGLRRRHAIQIGVVIVVLVGCGLLSSCGAGRPGAVADSSQSVSPGVYTIAIHGDSANLSVSTNAQITVN